jgi:hypothetical protein
MANPLRPIGYQVMTWAILEDAAPAALMTPAGLDLPAFPRVLVRGQLDAREHVNMPLLAPIRQIYLNFHWVVSIRYFRLHGLPLA